MSDALTIIRLQAHRHTAATKPSALAIGNFDGVHQGHRSVINATVAHAKAHNLVPSVLIFWPHPRYYFAPASPPFLLQPLHARLRSLHVLGVAQVFIARFDRALATMSAADFCEHIVKQACGARAVFTGENFVFGAARSGNIATLQAFGETTGIGVHPQTGVMVGTHVCASTHLRHQLEHADTAALTAMLGRPYTICGRVVRGDGRGRTLGFPTANIPLREDVLCPHLGVYAVHVRRMDGSMHAGVCNIGIRPTFGGDAIARMEVHLLDYQGADLYGQKLEVALMHFIRPEHKFSSTAELTDQIARDIFAARTAHKGTPHDNKTSR